MADDTLTMFGKTYNTVGSANTNLMLQTKGDLKIRWGNKFIDLIKNGKINVETETIKTANSSENIKTDGIYLIKNGDKDEIWIKIGDTLINLNQEVGLGYISYKEQLKLTADEKSIALSNIGIIFDTYANLTTSGIKNGFAYVVEVLKFFSIVDGKFSEYSFASKVSDPLEIGNITIKGTDEEILSKTKLSINSNNLIYFKLKGIEIASIVDDKINCNKYISSNKGILSVLYNDNVGYFVGINSQNKAIGVFDEIIVRNGINRIQHVTYEELRQLMKDRALIVNCEYEITDFLDIRNVTYNTDVELEDLYGNETKLKNVYPIIVKAKNSSELEPKGYFSDNPDWIIEYDPYYYHIVKYKKIITDGVETDNYNIVYSKGRIIKMTDEFGNTANFDFKHSTFTDDNKYLFNIANPRIKELDKLIEVRDLKEPLIEEKTKTNIYADATQDTDVEITVNTDSYGNISVKFERKRNEKIVNNTIYLAEPTLSDSEIVEDVKEIELNDYIIFEDCSTIFPNNNTINSVEGQFKILKQFDGNTFNGLVYRSDDVCDTLPVLIKNTADVIFLKDEDKVLFDIDSIYSGNIFGSISNSNFKKGLTSNSFKNLNNVIIDNVISLNIFEEDLQDLHIKSSSMNNNIFRGTINTHTNIDDYTIDGTLSNNIFEKDLECVVFDSTCVLIDNHFYEVIKYQSSVYTTFKGKIDKCLFGQINGCIFNTNSLLYNALFYNEDLYSYINLTLVTIDKVIRNSVFKDNITNIHFYDNIDRVTCQGVIGNNNTASSLGKVEFTTFIADILDITAVNSTINYCEFNVITKVTIKPNTVINNSTFNGEINNCEIEGSISQCTFEKLLGGIKVIGPLDNVNIQVNMSPTAAMYVEDSDTTYVLNNPFIISTTNVPKLNISGKKVCTILTKLYNNSNILVFIIKTSNEDYTPAGMIVMFNGLASQIPDGWTVCDGTKGTPDLRGRFIRMVSDGESVGAKDNSDLATNGNGTRQAYLKGNKVPKHTHTFNPYSNTITINGSSLSASYNGDVTLTLGVSFSNLSTNDVWTNGIWNLSLLTFTPRSSSDPDLGSFGYLTNSGEYNYKVWSHNKNFEHHHTITADSASITGSLPSISISGNISIPINFTPTQDPDETGFVEAVNVEPLAYALIFIMKL